MPGGTAFVLGGGGVLGAAEVGMLRALFERGIDPMMVIRWKDIFERLEDAIDSTERTANILEGIVIKNS